MKNPKVIKSLPFVFSGAAFIAVLLFLVATPRVVTLAESKIDSSNLIASPIPQMGDVAGASKQPVIQLTSQNIATPSVTALGVYAIDLDLNQPLFDKNSDTELAMASTTKIMTALVASSFYKAGQVLLVPPAAMVGGSTMNLVPGEQMTFRSMLYGMLLNSGNDAAFTFALDYPGGLDNFVAQMNQKALEMGLKDTHFQNPAGFDDPSHYTSAYDMSQIATAFANDPTLAKIVDTKATSVVSIDKTKLHELHNLNELLGIDGVVGIKTGTTEMSGENLVTLVEKDNHKILIVLLNSSDRFTETKNIIDWIFQNYTWSVTQ